ncbi:hypothetical protein PMAYCL1PPCAC_24876, partial [Pristionchus mayeri]
YVKEVCEKAGKRINRPFFPFLLRLNIFSKANVCNLMNREESCLSAKRSFSATEYLSDSIRVSSNRSITTFTSYRSATFRSVSNRLISSSILKEGLCRILSIILKTFRSTPFSSISFLFFS